MSQQPTGTVLPPLFDSASFDQSGMALQAPFAVVDVETTGFDPLSNRVVEIAVVHLDLDGSITGEWSTVVHGDGASGASHIHRLPPKSRLEAPGFDEIVPELLAQLSGRVVVAHNASFDERFLAAEFARSGIHLDPLPALCSLRLARRALPDLGGYRLAQCCHVFDVVIEDAHTALGDTRALASIVPELLALVPSPRFGVGVKTFPQVSRSVAAPRG